MEVEVYIVSPSGLEFVAVFLTNTIGIQTFSQVAFSNHPNYQNQYHFPHFPIRRLPGQRKNQFQESRIGYLPGIFFLSLFFMIRVIVIN